MEQAEHPRPGKTLLDKLSKLKKRVRERNREVNRRNEILEKVLNNIPVMITFYNAAGEVELVNRAAEARIGLNREEIQAVNLMEYCYPDPEYRRRV